MRRLDIAIAGAGPGGLTMALLLHAQGHRVVIYEQFEKPLPLGSGLIMQPTGLGVLDHLHLGQRLRGLGARIDRLSGSRFPTGKTVLDVRYEALGPARGYAVHRAALFNVLYDAVKAAQIPIENSSRIHGFEGGVLVVDKGRRSPVFDLVVDAMGAHSPLRRLAFAPTREKPLAYGAIWASLPWPGAGFDPHALMQRYDKAAVMIGVLPIGRMVESGHQQAAFFWSLKADEHATWKRDGLEMWKASVRRYWPETETLLQYIQSTDDLTMARYQHHTMAKPYGDRLICIGDSAHSTSPQLGQGANNALLDALALSEALQGSSDLTDAALAYANARRLHVRTYQALSLLFTPFYQSDSHVLPWLRDQVVSNAARVPVLQRLLARMVAGTLVTPIRRGDVKDGALTSP